MIVRRLDELRNTGAADKVAGGTVDVVRYLLAADGAGFSVSDVLAPAGLANTLQYKNHVEANLVLEGEGTVEDLATGEVHALAPGTLYVVYPTDRHVVRSTTDIRFISIFNPPLIGGETHDSDGSYPAAPTP